MAIQIQEELFTELMKFFLLDMRDSEREKYITAQIQLKCDKMQARIDYAENLKKKTTG